MSGEYTPGPWWVEIERSRLRSIAVVRAKADGVSVVVTRLGDHPDASLIAAAPELVEALENLLSWINVSPPPDSVIDAARTALEKAGVRP